jgi:thioredoxin-like negative regulator of GroEL
MDQAETLLNRAQSLLDSDQLTEAESVIDDLLKNFPDHGPAWAVKGDIRHRRADHQGCVDALEAASLRMELSAENQLQLAECYAKVGRCDLAKWLLRDIPAKPDSTDCIIMKTAASLGRLGESALSLDLCLLVHRRSPHRHEAAFGVAYYMNRIGKEASEVVPYLRAAYELAPDNVMYRVSLALCLDRLQRTEEAYRIVADLDLHRVEWPHCLTRLMEIFASAGDQSRYLDCQARMMHLGDPKADMGRNGDPERQ